MNKQVNYTMYKNEIKFVEKYREAACALGQLTKKDHVVFKELHKMVDTCLDEKVSQKSFKRCVKGMIMQGLVLETFSIDLKFRIELSLIGKDVHQMIRKNNDHLVAIDHS